MKCKFLKARTKGITFLLSCLFVMTFSFSSFAGDLTPWTFSYTGIDGVKHSIPGSGPYSFTGSPGTVFFGPENLEGSYYLIFNLSFTGDSQAAPSRYRFQYYDSDNNIVNVYSPVTVLSDGTLTCLVHFKPSIDNALIWSGAPVGDYTISVSGTYIPQTEYDTATLLDNFSQIAAWTWSEVGLLMSFFFKYPILALAMSLPFIGVIVAFFLRIFKSV